MYGKKQTGLFEKLGLWRDRRSSFQRFRDRTSEAGRDVSEMASELSNFASSAVVLGAKTLIGVILVALFLGATKLTFLLGWAIAVHPAELTLTIGGACLLWWGIRTSLPRKGKYDDAIAALKAIREIEKL